MTFAAWNIITLKLDRPSLRERRQSLLSAVAALETAVSACHKLTDPQEREATEKALDLVLKTIADHELFVHAFGLLIPHSLKAKLQSFEKRSAALKIIVPCTAT